MISILGLTLAGCSNEQPVRQETLVPSGNAGDIPNAAQSGEAEDTGGASGASNTAPEVDSPENIADTTPVEGEDEGEGEIIGEEEVESEGEGEGEIVGEGEGEMPRGIPAPLDFFKVADLPCD